MKKFVIAKDIYSKDNKKVNPVVFKVSDKKKWKVILIAAYKNK